MIVRNCNLLFWQYIDWIQVIRYIDSLKSRKYQKFTEETDIKSLLIHEPSVLSQEFILLVLRNEIEKSSLKFNEFELGYLLFCFYNSILLDVSFFFIIETKDPCI